MCFRIWYCVVGFSSPFLIYTVRAFANTHLHITIYAVKKNQPLKIMCVFCCCCCWFMDCRCFLLYLCCVMHTGDSKRNEWAVDSLIVLHFFAILLFAMCREMCFVCNIQQQHPVAKICAKRRQAQINFRYYMRFEWQKANWKRFKLSLSLSDFLSLPN